MFIKLEDAQLFATSYGSKTAPAMVGMGGWIGSWELWSEPFSVLSQTWRTIAYDHRGSGATMCSTGSITFERLVDDVFAVLDAFDVERCVLAGESAGGAVTLAAALKAPERIAGLVIVDGNYTGNAYRADSPFLLGLQTQYERTLDGFVQACVPEPNAEAIKRWGRQIINRASQEQAIALYQMMGSVDLSQQVGRIVQPTLIVHGEADAIVPLQAARFLAKTIVGSKLVILPGAGHVPTLTHPLQIAQAIDEFFSPHP